MKDTGGPAFPHPFTRQFIQSEDIGGMTLRDYFAAKAMQAVPLKWPPVLTEDQDAIRRDTEEIARGAYAMADAMLKAREK